MKISSVFLLAVLVAVSLNLPVSALELPWEKEGGGAPSQIPGQQRLAGHGVQAPGTQTGQRYAILLGVGKKTDKRRDPTIFSNVPGLGMSVCER